MKILHQYLKEFNFASFCEKAAQKRKELVEIPYWDDYRELLLKLGEPLEKGPLMQGPLLEIGSIRSLSESQRKLLPIAIKRLIPWRKGPFKLCGKEIDAEWRSDMKWDRISPLLKDAFGKRVADIGCGNGYYMLRLMEYAPEFVLGLDPNAWAYHQFKLLQRFAPDPRLSFELLGIEDITLFPSFFDIILCMGVIYHRRDPISSLRDIRDSLRGGGKLIFESMTVPIKGPYALSPPDRYSKLHNIFFVPSEDCMAAWLARSGFSSWEKILTSPLSSEEQRKTEFAPYESLEDFLMPGNPSLTIEGFPAPLRTVFIAHK